MSDMSTYVNVATTVISSIMAAIVVYYQFRKKKLEVDDETVCHKDFQTLQTKVAVLEERLDNEINMLDKLSDKLDDIRDKL